MIKIGIIIVVLTFLEWSCDIDVKVVMFSKSIAVSKENGLLLKKYRVVSKSANMPKISECWLEYIGKYQSGKFLGRDLGLGKHLLLSIEDSTNCLKFDSFFLEWTIEENNDFLIGRMSEFIELRTRSKIFEYKNITLNICGVSKETLRSDGKIIGYITIAPVRD